MTSIGLDKTLPCVSAADRRQSAEIDTAPKEVRADILPRPVLKNFTNRPGRIPAVTCEIRLSQQPVTCRQINVEALQAQNVKSMLDQGWSTVATLGQH